MQFYHYLFKFFLKNEEGAHYSNVLTKTFPRAGLRNISIITQE